jgi:hypothetical protein
MQPINLAEAEATDRLRAVTLEDLVLRGGMTVAALSGMSEVRLNQLVSGLVPMLAAEISKAVKHDSGSGGSSAAPRPPPQLRRILSTRGNVRSAPALIRPPDADQKCWREEFVPAVREGHRKLGLDFSGTRAHRETLEQYLLFCNDSGFLGMRTKTTGGGLGYTQEDAEILSCLAVAPVMSEIGAALQALALQDRPNPYAALTHAGYDVLSRAAAKGAKGPAPKCYASITDARNAMGLGDNDKRWLEVLTPDADGFQGFTSYAPMLLRRSDTSDYDPKGLKSRLRGKDADGKALEHFVTDSDIVCFESAPPDDDGKLHSAVQISRTDYMLPPLTLLTVQGVQEAGEWEFREGKHIAQRLITVSVTFLMPAEQGGAADSNKFAANHQFLQYSQGQVDLKLDHVTLTPDERPLTMAQEWARDDVWVDWQKVRHNGREEYLYVDGPAREGAVTGAAAGAEAAAKAAKAAAKRDWGHGGWTQADFLEAANAAVRQGAASQSPPVPVAPDDLLTGDEAFALRLYTGPCYQPINEFLRQAHAYQAGSDCGRKWRRRYSRSHQFSYASTVSHIAAGLRKLARANANFLGADGKPLLVYRGVRGELPEAFWLFDNFGHLTATDVGFMSTSLDRVTSEGFLGGPAGGMNVLWEIECSAETAEGLHSAADVSVLSQFPEERELLFPALSMLTLLLPDGSAPVSRAQGHGSSGTLQELCIQRGQTASGGEYACIRARATFV